MLFLISIIETVFFDKTCIHLGKVGKESKKLNADSSNKRVRLTFLQKCFFFLFKSVFV